MELLDKLNSVLNNMTEEDFVEMMNQAIEIQPLTNE